MFSVWIAFAGGITHAHAANAIAIDEIMYDLPGTNAGHQWVEIENAGSAPFDLSEKDLRFFDKSGAHVIAVYGGSSATLPAGSVAVIADKPAVFLADHPNFTGALFDSVVSLTASDILGLKKTDGTVLATATYTSILGAKGDGNSLHLSGSSFTAGAPNPGVLGIPAPILKQAASPPSQSSTHSKPSTPPVGFSKSTANTPTSTSSSFSPTHSYDKGISAPTAEAQTSAVGAAFIASSGTLLFQYLFSSIWFAVFLGLLVFSGTSLILIRKHA